MKGLDMDLFFSLFCGGFTFAWVVISFILDKKTGTSVLSYALFILGCLFYYLKLIIPGTICVIVGTCMLLLFFLIYKNEHHWEVHNDNKDNRE